MAFCSVISHITSATSVTFDYVTLHLLGWQLLRAMSRRKGAEHYTSSQSRFNMEPKIYLKVPELTKVQSHLWGEFRVFSRSSCFAVRRHHGMRSFPNIYAPAQWWELSPWPLNKESKAWLHAILYTSSRSMARVMFLRHDWYTHPCYIFSSSLGGVKSYCHSACVWEHSPLV